MKPALFQNTAITYTIGWASYYALTVIMLSNFTTFPGALSRGAVMIALQMGLFFLNLRVLLPMVFEKGKQLQYWLILVGMIGLAAVAAWVFERLGLSFLKALEFSEGNPAGLPPAGRMFGRVMIAVLPLTVSALVRNSILLKEREGDRLEYENKMLEAETKALRSQINPHFLFNTLNNIFTLSQLQSPHTGDAILQLSDMLRYVTYESSAREVSLSTELQYLRSYIQLQMLKDEDLDNVKWDLPEVEGRWRIAPMLLIPYVENAFKHSNFEDREQGWIEIVAKMEGNRFAFSCCNSLPEHDSPKDKVGGIGLENVRRRLELLYAGKFILNVKKEAGEFCVKLEIELE